MQQQTEKNSRKYS